MVIYRPVLVTLVLIGCFCGPAVHAQTTIPLQEAVGKGLATVEISGISISYQQPMVRMMISQVSGSTPSLVVSKGLVLTSEDPSFADLIIAHDSTVTLESGETKTLKLYAFSLDLTRSFPPPEALYSIRGMSSDAGLLALLDRIQDQHTDGDLAAQLAVWMQVKGYSLDRIERTLGVSLTKVHTATLSLLAPPRRTSGNDSARGQQWRERCRFAGQCCQPGRDPGANHNHRRGYSTPGRCARVSVLDEALQVTL